MSKPVHNLRPALRKHGAALVLPSVLAALLLGGVTVRPVTHLRGAQRTVAEAEARVSRLVRLDFELESIERMGGAGRARQATNVLARAIPRDVGSVEALCWIRLAAVGARVELSALEVGDLFEEGLRGADDRLVRREITVRGHGSAASPGGLVRRLSELGQPARWLDISLRRADGRTRRFELSGTLALYHRTALEGATTRAASEGDVVAGDERR